MLKTKAPKGFRFAVSNAGFRKNNRNDVALVVSDTPAVTAAMFTTNLFSAAPVLVGKELLKDHQKFRAILVNSGNANACTGDEGIENCKKSMSIVAEQTGLQSHEILPASTGVIGNQFDMNLWNQVAPSLASCLGECSADDFANAIMTTDRFPKITSADVIIDGKTITVLGMAKGAGMICPNMATMISALLCDADIDASLWQDIINKAVSTTFNRATVDGDTSTNDTIYALTNGLSGAKVTSANSEELFNAIQKVLAQLAYMLVQDGEGATKVMEVRITGAKDDKDAELAARTIGHSLLVKTAMFGQDANWGRIIAALGRSGCDFKAQDVVLKICGFELFKNSQPTVNTTRDGDDPRLVAALKEKDILVEISLGGKQGSYTLLASDLTLDYVKLNADYRS